MTTDTALKPWEALKALAEAGDAERLERYMEAIGPSDSGEVGSSRWSADVASTVVPGLGRSA